MPRFTNVDSLPTATAQQAADTIKDAMAAGPPVSPVFVAPSDEALLLEVSPGHERWSVKTGQDPEVDAFNPFIIDTDIAQMVLFPRPTKMLPPTKIITDHPRVTPVETTVWRLTANVVEILEEGDGDYHLVLHAGDAADAPHMVAEIPNPDTDFVGKDNPWFTNINDAHDQAQPLRKKGPADALEALDEPGVPELVTLPDGAPAPSGEKTFRHKVDPPVTVTITGCGFFDHVHTPPQDGVSLTNGIEIHPVLKLKIH